MGKSSATQFLTMIVKGTEQGERWEIATNLQGDPEVFPELWLISRLQRSTPWQEMAAFEDRFYSITPLLNALLSPNITLKISRNFLNYSWNSSGKLG